MAEPAASQPDRRARHRAAIVGAFAGVTAGDADEQLRHYTDDLVLELPFADPPVTVAGKERARSFLRRAFEVYDMTLTITTIHECLDPDTVIVEFTSDGRMTTTGRPYANTYIAVMRFEGGRIRSQREFFNPLIAERALATDG